MSTADRFTNEYSDVAGAYLRSGNWIDKAQSAATLTAAIQAATNSNLLYSSRGNAIVGTTAPATSTYPSVSDLAQFNFATGAGGRIALMVPAPINSMFLSDGTIDVTDPLASAIIAAVIGTLTDVTGAAAVGFVAGLLTSRRTEQNG